MIITVHRRPEVSEDIVELAELRSYPISGFPNHLIFYLTRPSSLIVVAVLHGARDLPNALIGRA